MSTRRTFLYEPTPRDGVVPDWSDIPFEDKRRYLVTETGIIEDLARSQVIYDFWGKSDLLGPCFGVHLWRKTEGRWKFHFPSWRLLDPNGRCFLRVEKTPLRRMIFSPYVDRIPPEARRFIGPFPRQQWKLLFMLASNPRLADLIAETPAYVIACLTYTDLSKFNGHRLNRLSNFITTEKRRHVLSVLSGQRISKFHVPRIIAFALEKPNKVELLSLTRVLSDPVKRRALMHVDRITPEYLNDLDAIPETLLQKNIVKLLDPPLARELREFAESWSAMCRLQPRDVIDRISSDLTAARSKSQIQAVLNVKFFKMPPINGNNTLIPITSERALRRHGREMNNCVGSLVSHVVHGRSFFYDWRGKERATVEISWSGSSDPVGRFRITVAGKANRRLSQVTERAIQQAVRDQISGGFTPPRFQPDEPPA